MDGFLKDVSFRREMGPDGTSWIVVGSRKFKEGKEAFTHDDRAYLHSGYPGQPPRQIAGPGKAFQDALLLVALIFAFVAAVASALR